jgi:GH24 family phage-related lysozyme (muramidase)
VATISLPAYRWPSSATLDTSGLANSIGELGDTIQRNRMLEAARIEKQRERQNALSIGASIYGPDAGVSQSDNRMVRAGLGGDPGKTANEVELIKGFEGFNPSAYSDRKQTSIGYGTKARPGETNISPYEAEARLRSEVGKVAQFVDQNFPGMDAAKRSAFISFGYNLGTGPGGLSDLIPDIKAGNWSAVSARMQRYNHARNPSTGQMEVVPGLTNRRQQEASMVTGATAQPPASGPNYAAGAQRAFQLGDTSTGLKLADAERQTREDARAQRLRALEIEKAEGSLEDAAVTRAAGVAQMILAEQNPEKQAEMIERFAAVSPRVARMLQRAGDPKAALQMLVEQARGIGGAKKDLMVAKPGDQIFNPNTGNVVYQAPNKPAQQLTAADRKEIIESDNAAQAGRSAVMALRQAIELNDKAYSGLAAQTRGYLTSLYGAEGGQSTEELGNIITLQALEQLKAVFGGMPTEGERKILLDVQGSINQAPEVRRRIWERAIDMANRRIDFNQRQSKALRSGEYYHSDYSPVSPDGITSQRPTTAPRAVNPQTGETIQFNEQTGQWEGVK